MPVEFDPAWEYAVLSPEMEEVREEYDLDFRLLGIEDRRLARTSGLPGIRFGKGNPNRMPMFRTRKERFKEERTSLNRKTCPTCGETFWPRRKETVYCRLGCVPHPGGTRIRADRLNCLRCGKVFEPLKTSSRFCSRKCGGNEGGAERKLDYDLIKELYEAGHTSTEVAKLAGVSDGSWVRKILKSMGVKMRPKGSKPHDNYRRKGKVRPEAEAVQETSLPLAGLRKAGTPGHVGMQETLDDAPEEVA